MPQIDFGRAFENHEKAKPVATFPPVISSARMTAPAPEEVHRLHFARSDWANIIFVIITVLGGLFCAFYFFNGAELMRSAAAWPAELLYKQPADTAAFAKIDNGIPMMPNEPAIASTGTVEHGPFNRSAESLLNPDTQTPTTTPTSLANTPTTSSSSPPPPPPSNPTIGSIASGVIDQLTALVPGGDALTQSLNSEAAALQSAAGPTVASATNATQAVTQKISQTRHHALTSARKTTHSVRSQVTTQRNNATRVVSQKNASTPLNTNSNAQSLNATRGIGPGTVGGIGPGVVGGVGNGGGIGPGTVGGLNGGGIGPGTVGGLNGVLHGGGLLGGRH